MKLSYDLTIEQTQKLTMTPELIQAIKILQYNSLELENYIKSELLENPLLDEGETNFENSTTTIEYNSNSDKISFDEDNNFDSEKEEYIEKIREAEYDDISYKQWDYSRDNEKANPLDFYASKDASLVTHLLSQLSVSELSNEEKKIGRFLIEAVDENGYIDIKLKDVAKLFNTDNETVGYVLDTIQTFDPVGVLARTLEECLIIQLKEKGLLEDSIEYVILNHLEDLGNNRLNVIAKKTGLSLDEIKLIQNLIKTLDPKPGRNFSSNESVKYIIPDVKVEIVDNSYQIITNDSNVPTLTISQYYSNLAKSKDLDQETAKYLNNKYDQAVWLIKSIEQRRQTITNVVQEIIKFQNDFFNKGPKYIKTLTMREIADSLGIHESTVSRAISGKYIETPKGIYELKYFFTSGVKNKDGEGVSSNSVKEFIKEIINQEDPKHPYSDQDIVELLKEKSIDISRRTVTKYRESMNILSSSKRRRY